MKQQKIYFKDIIGNDSTKEKVRSMIAELKNFKNEESSLLPKGILFIGESGSGKTMFMNAIKNEANIKTYTVPIETDEISQMRSMKRIFKKARRTSPSIIFLDELDRYTSDNSRFASKSIIEYVLLEEMDGMNKTKGVLVVASIIDKDNLSETLLRGGRFEYYFKLRLPNESERLQLLNKYTSNLNIDDKTKEYIINRTHGFKAEDFKKIALSMKIYTDKNNSIISKNDLDIILEEISLKDSLNELKKDEKQEELIAYHEAGHAVASYLLNKKIESASINSYGKDLGFVKLEENEEKISLETYESMIDNIVIALASVESEKLLNSIESLGCGNDKKKAYELARNLVEVHGYKGFKYMRAANILDGISQKKLEEIEEKVNEILKETTNIAHTLINGNKDKVLYIKDKLLQYKSLSNDEISDYLINYNQDK